VFNDIAVSAGVAMADYGIERVLVVDLDVHQGNGTAAIFEDDPRVVTFDMHGGPHGLLLLGPIACSVMPAWPTSDPSSHDGAAPVVGIAGNTALWHRLLQRASTLNTVLTPS
jgi:hypothetical protein